MIVLGLNSLDIPANYGKEFSQNMAVLAILMTNLVGIILNGNVFHMARIRSLITQMNRSMSATCSSLAVTFNETPMSAKSSLTLSNSPSMSIVMTQNPRIRYTVNIDLIAFIIFDLV